MTTIFLIVALIALGSLILFALIDGIGEALSFDFMDGILGPISISAFFMVFGFTGYWLSGSTGWSTVLVVAISVVAGALIFAPVGLLTKFLENSTTGTVSNDTLTGVVGTVITDIKVGALGQVRLNHSGHIVTMAATADEQIESPTSVKVLSLSPPSTIHVERLHPLAVPVVEKTETNDDTIDLSKSEEKL